MVLMLRKLLLFKRKYARTRAILSGFVVDQKQREIFFAFFAFCLVLSFSLLLKESLGPLLFLCTSSSSSLLLLYTDNSRAAARFFERFFS
jgi:hypothetical protein